MATTAYIIGNGPSRKGLDLDTLDGTIFGCNALFRDYPADYLVSGDSTIIKEICESDYPADNKCIFPDFDPVPKEYKEMMFLLENSTYHVTGYMTSKKWNEENQYIKVIQ